MAEQKIDVPETKPGEPSMKVEFGSEGPEWIAIKPDQHHLSWATSEEWLDDGDVKYIRADLVPQWQPIETAPKDGTKIVLFWPEDKYCSLGAWFDDPMGGCWCFGTWEDPQPSDESDQPTLWMSLGPLA